jgi:uncharacterized protein YchJ
MAAVQPLNCIAVVASTGTVCNKGGVLVGTTCLCTRHRNAKAYETTVVLTAEQFHAHVLAVNATIMRRWTPQRRAQLEQNRQWQRQAIAQAAAAARIPPPAPPAPAPAEGLRGFSLDNQNVHRKESVKMTTEAVTRVLKILVPKEYAWNTKRVSKTPGEIIADCELDPHACVQFMNRYLQNEEIYGLGAGIYGKVIDGIWQYIKGSDDKADLCKILRSELKDSVRMCLAGNLTRICNVVAGYLDGIGSYESQAERLGRLMPKLMEIEDDEARFEAAKKVLAEVGLPKTDWDAWLEAVV